MGHRPVLIRPIPELRGKYLEVHAVNTTMGKLIERQPWKRRMGDMLWGAVLGWSVALVTIALAKP